MIMMREASGPLWPRDANQANEIEVRYWSRLCENTLIR
jgi:hypothetical protein